MSTADFQSVRYLFGPWSVFALVAGLAGWLLSEATIGARLFRVSETTRSLVIRRLPWFMAVAAWFLGALILPGSYAYSGPIPPEIRDLHRYDIRFAFMIAYTFGFAFALDSIRLKGIRNRVLACISIGLYGGVAMYLIRGIVGVRA